MNDGTTSPPYPSEQTNSRALYNHLEAVRQWVIDQQDTLRGLIPEKYAERLVPPDDLECLEFWDNISVIDKHTVLVWLRRIREGWDQILRQHEDSWDSKLALSKRYSIVINTMHVLQESFVSPELREHQNKQAADKARRRSKLIDQHLQSVLIPDELKDEINEEVQQQEDVEEDWFASEDGADNADEESGEFEDPDITGEG